FKYPYYIRKAICTTNAIEAVHRQFRTLTKTKGDFMNENSMLKLLCAHIFRLEKMDHVIQNWGLRYLNCQ
ncbi:MAG: transposase, partial [Shewanella sp.]